MNKEVVQMSIKMDPGLRDDFMAVAAERHRPAAQIIRELMRSYIAYNEEPNKLTAETIRKSRQGIDVHFADNASDLFKQLDL